MPKQYRALVGFSCPADPESLKKRQQALKAGPGDKADALNADVSWMEVKAGAKVTPYNDAILESWLSGGFIEEVKSDE